jgi:hypothetical protein
MRATRKRKPVENPVCKNPDHFKEPLKIRKRQRHTCYKCMSTDLAALNSNPSLTRWDVTRIMVSLTRAYVCSVCLLSHTGDKVTSNTAPKVIHCKKHSVFNEKCLCVCFVWVIGLLNSRRWWVFFSYMLGDYYRARVTYAENLHYNSKKRVRNVCI